MWSNRGVPLRSLVAATLLSTSVATPTVGLDVRDDRRDVQIFTRVPGPPAAERRSIDLRRVVVTPGPETVRFKVRIARLLPSAAFDQVADILLLPPADADVDWAGTEVWISTKRPRTSFATFYSTVAEPVACPRLPAGSNPATGWFWLDVPRACLPPGEVAVEVLTLATTARNGARPYSRDVLSVPGTVVWDAP